MKHYRATSDEAFYGEVLGLKPAPITYDTMHTVTLSVQDWLGIRTQLAFASWNNVRDGHHATAEVTRELLDKLRVQTQQAMDAAADAADAEDAA